jgi:hypothetical protein
MASLFFSIPSPLPLPLTFPAAITPGLATAPLPIALGPPTALPKVGTGGSFLGGGLGPAASLIGFRSPAPTGPPCPASAAAASARK